MIVRNEMDRFLPLAVTHLLSYCDEIRVLDDNSDDGTFEWLRRQRRVKVARNDGPSFYEYESKARQLLLQWTLDARPDYVLSIDADEFVGQPGRIQSLLGRVGTASVYTLDMQEIWEVTAQEIRLRMDGLWGPRRCPILWRAPENPDDVGWHIPDRKLACGREPLAVRRSRFEPTNIPVLHFGWTRRSQREERAERYFVHDQGQFHKDAHLQSILWPDERIKLVAKPWPQNMQHLIGPLLENVNRDAET